MKPPSRPSWPAAAGDDAARDADWQATRAQTAMATQLLLRDRDDDDDSADIGQRIDARQRELFVSCDPAEALQQQFELRKPEFIAIHDAGAATSRRFVAALAANAGVPVQQLLVRRQGLGVALASLEFVDLPAGDGTVRIYTTEIDADTHSRHAIARVLLSFSRLGVLMLGDLPAHALATTLKPIADAIGAGPWPNRQLLLLPLAASSALASKASTFGTGSLVSVRTTPLVANPGDAWSYVQGAWNRLRTELAPAGVVLAELGAARTAPPPPAPAAAPAPLPMRPMPPIAAPRTAAPASATPPVADAPAEPLARYVAHVAEITGMVSACVFDVATQRPLAHAGARPGPAMLASHGATVAAALGEASRALGLGVAPPDAAISLAAHHLVLRPLPGRPGLMLHAVLDKSAANLTLARLQISRLDAILQ